MKRKIKKWINLFKIKLIGFNSRNYWEKRYEKGGNSGSGSYGKHANFKKGIINTFVESNAIKTVVEFGCGDGNQLLLANYNNYLGYDVTEQAIELCKKTFPNDTSKTFLLYDPKLFNANSKYDLVLSLDVLYHIIEEEIFVKSLSDIFNSSLKYVIIFSSNFYDSKIIVPHIKNRKFTDYVEKTHPDFRLIKYIKNPYRSEEPFAVDFYIFEKNKT